MQIQNKTLIAICYATVMLSLACSPKFTEEDKGDFTLVKNEGGKTLGYNPDSGVKLLQVDRLAFKIGVSRPMNGQRTWQGKCLWNKLQV